MKTKYLIAFIFFVISFCSVRADIVYEVNSSDVDYSANTNSYYFGNTFSTGSQASTLKTISLYLSKSGTISGNLYLKIYATTGPSGPENTYVPMGAALGSSSIAVSLIGAGSDVVFNYSGVNLAANTRYAFQADFNSVLFGPTGSITYYTNSDGYRDQNYFRTPDDPADTGYTTGLEGVQGVVTVDVASVPEPGTLILTGTALAAGAIGAYIKRRRKAKADLTE
jgi:hypothetical protein